MILPIIEIQFTFFFFKQMHMQQVTNNTILVSVWDVFKRC